VPLKPIDYSAFSSNPFGQIRNERELDLREFSYSVTSISNEPSYGFRGNGGTKWAFIIEVLSSYENVQALAVELGRIDPERFGNLTISTSRYMGFDPKAEYASVPFGKLEFGFVVYDNNELWIERVEREGETTVETLLGFPASGESLTLEEMVDLLVNEQDPYESYQYGVDAPLPKPSFSLEEVRLKLPPSQLPPSQVEEPIPEVEEPTPKKPHIRRLSSLSEEGEIPAAPRRVVRRIGPQHEDD